MLAALHFVFWLGCHVYFVAAGVWNVHMLILLPREVKYYAVFGIFTFGSAS